MSHGQNSQNARFTNLEEIIWASFMFILLFLLLAAPPGDIAVETVTQQIRGIRKSWRLRVLPRSGDMTIKRAKWDYWLGREGLLWQQRRGAAQLCLISVVRGYRCVQEICEKSTIKPGNKWHFNSILIVMFAAWCIKASTGETVEVTGGEKAAVSPPPIVTNPDCSAINDSSVSLFVTFITSPFTLSWDFFFLSNHNLICHPKNCLCVISHYFGLLYLFTVWLFFPIKYWSVFFVSHPAVFPPVSVRLLTQ